MIAVEWLIHVALLELVPSLLLTGSTTLANFNTSPFPRDLPER